MMLIILEERYPTSSAVQLVGGISGLWKAEVEPVCCASHFCYKAEKGSQAMLVLSVFVN
jgi:hypothetical protein